MKNPRISWEIEWNKTALLRPSPSLFFSRLLYRFLKRPERCFFRFGYLLHVLYIAETMSISRAVVFEKYI
jgi:hypothetical protein